MDEVTGGVDQRSIAGLVALVLELKQRGLTMVMIEHNMQVIMGLADRIVERENVRSAAIQMAEEIARAAPLATQATREMLNVEYITAFRVATERESFAQNWLRETNDYREGVQAGFDKRKPIFTGT